MVSPEISSRRIWYGKSIDRLRQNEQRVTTLGRMSLIHAYPMACRRPPRVVCGNFSPAPIRRVRGPRDAVSRRRISSPIEQFPPSQPRLRSLRNRRLVDGRVWSSSVSMETALTRRRPNGKRSSSEQVEAHYKILVFWLPGPTELVHNIAKSGKFASMVLGPSNWPRSRRSRFILVAH